VDDDGAQASAGTHRPPAGQPSAAGKAPSSERAVRGLGARSSRSGRTSIAPRRFRNIVVSSPRSVDGTRVVARAAGA